MTRTYKVLMGLALLSLLLITPVAVYLSEGAVHIKASAYYPEEFERRVIGWFDRH